MSNDAAAPDSPPGGLVYEETKPGEFFVQAPDGTVGTVPEADLAQAQADGYRAASPEEVQAARDRAIYESGGGLAATAALGAGRGLFMGLPVADAAFAQSYGDQAGAKQTIKDLQATNPGTFIGGEVAGSMLLPGPGKGSGLAKAVTHAAGEGALYGLGSAVSDSYLNNTALTGEKLAAAAFGGGAVGGGVAGGIGLGGRGIGALFRKGGGMLARAAQRPGAKALQRAGDDVFGRAAPGLGKALDALDATTSSLSGAPRGALSSMLRRGPSGRLGYEVATSADDVLARVGDDTFERLARVQDTQAAIQRRFKGDLKADQVSRLVSRGDGTVARQTDAAKRAMDIMRRDIGEMLEREADFSGRKFLRKTSKRLDSLERKIDAAIATGDSDAGAKAFMWLDGLKRDVGERTTKMTRRAQRGGTADDLATAKWFDGTYERLRGVLEDGDTWGRAAGAQRAINKQWAGAIEGGRDFAKLFTTTKQGRFGADERVVDRGKVGAFIRGLKNPDKAPTLDALNQHLDEILDFTETAGRHMDLPAAERKQIATLADEVTALRKSLGDGKEAIALRNQYRALQEAEGAGGALGLGAVGGLIGGVPGAALGSALGVLTKPGQAIRKLAAVHRVVGDIDTRKARALAGVVAGAMPKVSAAKVARAASATWKPEYDRRSRATTAAVREPDAVRGEAMATLAPVAPGAQAAAQMAADAYLRRQQHLAGLMPGQDHTGILAAQRLPNASEAHKYLEAARILDDPTQLLQAAGEGSLSASEVNAVAEVYPGMLREMRREVAQELTRLDEQGKAVPYGRRVALSIMLDAPVDPLMQPETIALLQSTYANAAGGPAGAPQRPSRKAPDLAKAYRTGTQDEYEDY